MSVNRQPGICNRTRRLIIFPFALALLAVASPPALASFHLMVIQEVFVGTPEDSINPSLTPDQRAQYVMLRMTNSGQTLVGGAFIRLEGATGNILGKFGTFAGSVSVPGTALCSYPSCPALIVGTTAAKNLFTFPFDTLVDSPSQAGRVAIPRAGGRACFVLKSGALDGVIDCVAWGNFSCSAANCPGASGGSNGLHSGDFKWNTCDIQFGTPAAAATGLQFGRVLARTVFDCAAQENSTQFPYLSASTLPFPHPVANRCISSPTCAPPNTINNNNTDTDADGLINQLDCCPSGAGCNTIFWRAIEVQNQKVTRTSMTNSQDAWDAQPSTSGPGVTYDEVRGTLSLLNGFTDDACFNSGNSTTSSPDTTPRPAAGTGYYYLVRGNGIQCAGTYGPPRNAAARDPSITSCTP